LKSVFARAANVRSIGIGSVIVHKTAIQARNKPEQLHNIAVSLKKRVLAPPFSIFLEGVVHFYTPPLKKQKPAFLRTKKEQTQNASALSSDENLAG
jgi:hypothetical protein